MNTFADDEASWNPQRIAQCLAASAAETHGDHDLNSQRQPPLSLCPAAVLALRPAAVLVGLVARPSSFNIVLTRRTEHLEHHPGQISFPGGHVEPTDKNRTATALRETEEEIGFPARRIDVLGQLDIYITQTGFCITPVVGLLRPPLDFVPDPNEVAEVFEVPLSFILNPTNHHRHRCIVEGTERQFYALSYAEHNIWGATAGILINFYTKLQNKAFMDANTTT